MFRTSRNMRSVASVVVVALLVGAMPPSASAMWGNSDPCKTLPGITCTGEMLKQLAIIGGLAAGAALVYWKFFRKPHTGEPQFEISPSELSFGDTGGDTGTKILRITNAGDSRATVQTITLSGRSFEFVMLPDLPFEIPANGNVEVAVRFHPEKSGTHKGHVVVETRSVSGDAKRKWKIDMRGKTPRAAEAATSSVSPTTPVQAQ